MIHQYLYNKYRYRAIVRTVKNASKLVLRHIQQTQHFRILELTFWARKHMSVTHKRLPKDFQTFTFAGRLFYGKHSFRASVFCCRFFFFFTFKRYCEKHLSKGIQTVECCRTHVDKMLVKVMGNFYF